MNRSKFSFAAVFSLMVLLAYSFLMFMGLIYWRGGSLGLPISLTLGFIALVVVCLTVMCMSRATRWKRIGTIGQCIFGFIILLAFIASAVPFTNFMDVVAQKSRFNQEINNVLNSARGLDRSYEEYTEERLANYRERLTDISNHHSDRAREYSQCLAGAPGNTDERKIENLVNSLRRKLVADSVTQITRERQQWLESSADMSVWNLMLPTNMSKISEEVTNWTQMYTNISDISYSGEQAEPFRYPDFNTELASLTQSYTTLHAPSVLAILVALLCFAIMLLPYMLTERDVAGRVSKGTSVYE